MGSVKPALPETVQRPDYPRLVKLWLGDHESRIKAVEAGGGGGGSGTFALDDGTATADGVFSFDEGGA